MTAGRWRFKIAAERLFMSAVFPMDDLDSAPLFESDPQVAQLRVPPHSIEAESSVLGGLLLDNGAWDRVGDLVSENDYYRPSHKLVHGAIATLVNGNKPADVITVFEHLQSQGLADEVGGLAYLNQLAQYVPSAANIRRYAEIVRERAILRKLVSASVRGAAIDPAMTYRLALNNFQANGGDGYPKLTAHPGYVNAGFVDADVMREYLTHHRVRVADFEPGDAIVRR